MSRLRRRNVATTAALTLVLALAALGLAVVAVPEGDAFPPSSAPSLPLAAPAPEGLLAVGPLLHTDFTRPLEAEWTPWSEGDPARVVVEPAPAGGVLLGLDTRSAPVGAGLRPGDPAPAPVAAVGLVSRRRFPAAPGLRVRAVLDWAPPDNACYRTAGLLLAAPSDAPLRARHPAVWLEVLGVPPGHSARTWGALRTPGGRERPLWTDGWPTARAGRPLPEVTLELELTPTELVLREDGHERARAPAPAFGPELVVVLYTSSHSNYPARPVRFRALQVDSPAAPGHPDLALLPLFPGGPR